MKIEIQGKKYKVVGEIKDNKTLVDLGDHRKEVHKEDGIWSWSGPFPSSRGYSADVSDK